MSSMEQQLSRAIGELQILEKTLEDLQGSIAALRAALREYEGALELIEDLKGRGSASNILVPIGGGNLIEAEVRSVEEVHVSLGAGIIVRQPVEKAVDLIKRRMESLSAAIRSREEALVNYSQRAEELRRLIQALYRRIAESQRSGGEGGAAPGQ